jgi:competence protein ComEA
MDDSAAPWRALETTTVPADADEPGARNLLPFAGLVLAAVLGIGAYLAASSGGQTLTVDGEKSTARPVASDQQVGASPGGLVVEIVGAVDKPGVYRLPPGSRVGDLVRAAGGYGPRVDTRRAGQDLNLAALLQDGQQVRVPSRDDAATNPGPANSGGGLGGLVNLNSATQAELEALPGIGPVTAGKIIGARPFASVDDLKSRKVVGEATFNKIRELVAVN